MKNLKVKWMPETVAMVSLTIATAPTLDGNGLGSGETSVAEPRNNFPGKWIVISDGDQLRAQVMRR